jgi:hypothetical protein
MQKNLPLKRDQMNGKLHRHRPGLPGKAVSCRIVPLDPAYMAGLAGHMPVKTQSEILDIEALNLIGY